MDRKTYLEIEELNKKIYYANKSVDTIKEVSEKIKTDLELTNQAVVESNEKISKNSENIGVLRTGVDNNSVAIETLATNLSGIDLMSTNNKNNIDKLTTNIGNPNLLINGNFAINQRGKSSYTSSGYTVDRWRSANSYGKVQYTNNGITYTASGGTAYLIQEIEETAMLWGKTITMSMLDGAGNLHKKTITLPETAPTANAGYGQSSSVAGANVRLYYANSKKTLQFTIDLKDGNILEPVYCKLEIGGIATPNVSRPYAEELLLCQRYYEKGAANSIIKLAYSSNLMYDQQVVFKVQKRTTPTVACYSNSNTKNALTNSSNNNNVTVTYTHISSYGFRVYAASGGFSKDHTVTGYYEADAEI